MKKAANASSQKIWCSLIFWVYWNSGNDLEKVLKFVGTKPPEYFEDIT